MLRIQDVRKKYVTGELEQTALDGVSLNLRESELVAILGPSGSGKSTLLNVIGGLDQYDSGDLIIDGISTKNYTDRDWDSYRNHTIGFVFQSYNLIPHQTVLANVELALTISGVPKKERRDRAVRALEQVGLGNQLHKKPNQMSGGQMQRVAIARALVNNPRILLADEPTGALDSETSIQVMELLKEVSRDRLVVMVTHNPELAYQYADRIVKVKDGKIMGDTNPYVVDEQQVAPAVHKNMGKSSMSFWSALVLSFNNLKCKKGRTLLTAFAGSIGIIGIALILALSMGFQSYIDEVQADTLADNPLTLQSETANMMSMLMPSASPDTAGSPEGIISEQPALSEMLGNFGSNDLGAFKTYLEEHYNEIGHTLNSAEYWYNITPRIYADRGLRKLNPSSLFKDLTGNDLISAVMDVNAFQQMPGDRNLLNSQFQVLEGRWPEKPQELVFVLPGPHQLSDHIAYTLGMKDLDSLQKMVDLLMDGQEVSDPENPMAWSYQELMQMQFRLVNVPDLYRFHERYGVWEDLSQDEEALAQVVADSEVLQVVGIVCPQEGKNATALKPGIAYTPALTEHIVKRAGESDIVKQQLADPSVNVFTGRPFNDPDSKPDFDFHDLITIDGDAISSAFGVNIDNNAVIQLMEDYLKKIAQSVQVDTAAAQQSFISAQTEFTRQILFDFMAENADAPAVLKLSQVGPLVDTFFQSQKALVRINQLTDAYGIPQEQFLNIFKPLTAGILTDYIAHSVEFPQTEKLLPSGEETVPETASETVPQTTAETIPEIADTPDIAPLTETVPQETIPQVTVPAIPDVTVPQIPDATVPEISLPELNPEDLSASVTADSVEKLINSLPQNLLVKTAAPAMAKKMMQPRMIEQLKEQVAGFSQVLARYFQSSLYVDGEKMAGAFHLKMDEGEIKRVLDALNPQKRQQDTTANLRMLGYTDLSRPDSISLYLSDFESKEEFIDFLQNYNETMAASGQEDKVILYTDMTAMMMDSVRTIIRTVSYCLMAFVGVSLLVSSIMIGIITYISVMERTKEIGVLRAMGASKHNISQVFNAETFIIGLCAGLLGIGITLLLIVPGNLLLHKLLETDLVNAYLPFASALVLIAISMVLTTLGGLVPSHQAAKKDPVIALRSE